MAGGLGGTAIYRNNSRKSASLERFSPNIGNSVAKRTPLLDFFNKRKKIYTGGTSVAVRFRYKHMGALGENTHVNAWNYYDKLTVQPMDVIKTGEEPWSNLNNPVSISHEEQIENSGSNEFDLVKTNTEIAMDELAQNENNILWGVAGGDVSKLPTSIPAIVSGATAGTIAGLSKASNTWLYSQYTAAIGDAATYLFDKMTTGYNSCIDAAPAKAVDKLDGYFMDKETFEVLQSELSSYFAPAKKEDVDIGFPTITHMGMKCYFDSTCPLDADGNHQVFGLMSKYWEKAIEKTMNYKTTPFYDMLPELAADIAQIFLRTATICLIPRTNWWGYGVTIS